MAQSISLYCEPDGSDTVITEIISAIAEMEGVGPADLHPPLYDVIDLEALGAVLSHDSGFVSVSFTYNGQDIELQSKRDTRGGKNGE
ncbi:HalOD1 output domain-containing protein [Natronosalvus rutilus]|uniref:Halobacterial output domain-containing protein n=1 Tax=Natronosalvus rutilus TaxID=2953753 RepID=A0A9E7NAL0_9EURY|nr:HalOD1 output domain-containing protein [Natronosalvus rutilus]UTF54752.1 hypothetical protein NGM29_05640 [Natronosalvus rutilus]